MTDSLVVPEDTHPVTQRRAVRAIALFEAIKGIAAVAAIVGVLDLMHRDVRHLAIELIGHFGWNPAGRYSSVVLHYADVLTNADVRSLVFLALGYILLRLLEAYGLWNDRAWGEWLGALSGALYIPFEIRHLLHRSSVISAAVLAANVFVVGYLVFRLWCRRKKDTIRHSAGVVGAQAERGPRAS
ncbi:MAG: DUF2127 domain-containing protein [Burkholderiales bacterium]